MYQAIFDAENGALLANTEATAGKLQNLATEAYAKADYYEQAAQAAYELAKGEVDAGILICRSGIGMTIAANKVNGVRCALCYNEETAKSAKEHNNANVITFGADYINLEQAIKIIELWKDSKFLDGIYQERLDIVQKYELERK